MIRRASCSTSCRALSSSNDFENAAAAAKPNAKLTSNTRLNFTTRRIGAGARYHVPMPGGPGWSGMRLYKTRSRRRAAVILGVFERDQTPDPTSCGAGSGQRNGLAHLARSERVLHPPGWNARRLDSALLRG